MSDGHVVGDFNGLGPMVSIEPHLLSREGVCWLGLAQSSKTSGCCFLLGGWGRAMAGGALWPFLRLGVSLSV